MKKVEGGGSGMQKIDLKILKRMLKFMEDAGLSELDLEMEGVKVRLRKAGSEAPAVVHAPVMLPPAVPYAPAPQTLPAAAAPAAVSPAQPPMTAPPPVAAPKPGAVIRSPMVGTFYRAPSPTASPFVSAGDTVKEGQTLCLIEAMKLMNEIKAERGGTITRVVAENGQPVEFDQPLFEMDSAE